MTLADHELSRFLAKIDRSGDHWLWTAGLLQGSGYGRFWLHGRTQPAHRVAYEHFVGPISDDLTIDHLCRVRSCCNPTHLEPVPMGVNLLRGQGWAAKNARKTHCPRGHEYTPGNTRITSRSGRRVCRTCKRAAVALWHSEHPDWVVAASRRYYLAHRERILAQKRIYGHPGRAKRVAA